MDDRELLELAAKAVGGKLISASRFGDLYDIRGHQIFWDPLTDDGQALRLAIALRLDVSIGQHSVQVAWSTTNGLQWLDDQSGICLGDAVRRTIVRVAAQIGKSL